MSYSGRGFSRGGGGGFRGRRGGGGGSWRGGRNSFNDSSEGRFNSNYEQRSRGYFRGRNERFNDRGRENKRPFRQENRDYSDFSRSSPEPLPKRMRRESPSYSGGLSRRSHERSFGDDFPSRSFYNQDKRSGDGMREDDGLDQEVGNYQYRKPRGGRFNNRGRGRYSRVSVRNRPYNRQTAFARRRNENFIRKKSFTTRSQEQLERLYTKLKRRLREEDEKKDDSEESDWDKELGDMDDEDKDDILNDDEVGEKDLEEADKDVNEDEDNDKDEKEEKVKDEGAKTKGKAKEKEGFKSPTKKTDLEDIKSGDETKDEDKDDDEDEDKTSTTPAGISKHRLRCIHCGFSSIVFKEYRNHIKQKKHQNAMKAVFMKLRDTLARMRVEQRRKQRMLDEENQVNAKLRSVFCNVCKLNYRMYKSDHIQSVSHKRMEEFLYPLCRTCLISFKTPMKYEEHICDLDHIKRKIKQRKGSGSEDEDEEDQKDLDSNNFLVLDSVGSGDESEGEKSVTNEEESNEVDDEAKSKDGDEVKKKKKPEFKFDTLTGAEYCKVVEAYYCDLCKFHLADKGDKNKTLTIHCRSRGHLRKWMREAKLEERRALLKAKAAKEAKKVIALTAAKKGKLVAKAKAENKEELTEGESKKTSVENGTEDKESMDVDQETSPKPQVKKGKSISNLGGGDSVANDTLASDDGSEGDTKKKEAEDKEWSEMDQDLSEMLDEEEKLSIDESQMEKESGTKTTSTNQTNGEIPQEEKV